MILSGVADYTLWYNSDETLGTNLVVVEAKRSGWVGQAAGQIIAYMGEFILLEAVYLYSKIL